MVLAASGVAPVISPKRLAALESQSHHTFCVPGSATLAKVRSARVAEAAGKIPVVILMIPAVSVPTMAKEGEVPAPVDEEVRVAVDDAELEVRYVGCGYVAARVPRR